MAAAGILRDNLFRNSTDMVGVRREPRFALAICVQNADARAVRQILEKLLEEEPQEISLEAESVSSAPGNRKRQLFFRLVLRRAVHRLDPRRILMFSVLLAFLCVEEL